MQPLPVQNIYSASCRRYVHLPCFTEAIVSRYSRRINHLPRCASKDITKSIGDAHCAGAPRTTGNLMQKPRRYDIKNPATSIVIDHQKLQIGLILKYGRVNPRKTMPMLHGRWGSMGKTGRRGTVLRIRQLHVRVTPRTATVTGTRRKTKKKMGCYAHRGNNYHHDTHNTVTATCCAHRGNNYHHDMHTAATTIIMIRTTR
jgi:hypothetical protein